MTIRKPFPSLTAEDLMNRDVVTISAEMPLQAAAHLLSCEHISGAPVVDAQGKCVGVLSAIDFLHLAERRDDVTKPASPPLPITCSFQVKQRRLDGKEVTRCTLPPGVCPIQVRQSGPEEEEMPVCSQPHCVLSDWQVVDVEKLPTDEVRRFMTADPVTAQPTTSVRTLALMMLDAHIHRVIVTDEQSRPIGIVSSTDILAAVAYAHGSRPDEALEAIACC
jgi:CBS domain-containing protein